MAYDVLIYISDQHSANGLGCMGNQIVDTPCINSLSNQGFVFRNAYTSCPLCVPARASFMTSRMPSSIGVFDNNSDYRSSEVTFAHLHAIAGYESTLIGRMHFMGLDQYHGFTSRIGVDFSPGYWGNPSEKRLDMGDFGKSLYQKWCLEAVGEGDSPVLDYDRKIVSEAISYLNGNYDKPQLIVVGTYAPHFPYVAPSELMDKYRHRLSVGNNNGYEEKIYGLPSDSKIQQTSNQRLIEIRAAYYSMIEIMDRQVGLVHSAFNEYLKRNKRKGIFIYMSDHGDQIGYKGIFGKQTFFENSSKIPLIFEISDMTGHEIKESVSILDIGPTICELNQIDSYPVCDGHSFAGLLNGISEPERYAVSEFYDKVNNSTIIGRMVHCQGYKLISYKGFEQYDLLFNTEIDPEENDNVRSLPIYNHMKDLLTQDVRLRDRSNIFEENRLKWSTLSKFGSKFVSELNPFSYVVPDGLQHIEKRFEE